MFESDYLDFTAPVPAENREHWKPENDDQANWCLEKISEAKAEIMDARAFYEAKKRQLDQWLENTIAPYNRDCEHFEALLAGYAEESLAGKKKRTISLPGGKFGFRKVPAKIDRDATALLAFVESGAPEFIKVKKSFDWAGLKKSCRVDGDHMVTADGEIVPGVTVTEQPDKFVCEVI
ncbi:host-nuclease inhibitor Gam family protein [Acidaminococcus provencensis]|uniref:host-nuclease inhibitor Gam family protein n=1 Tax=Acidaminococcus provencensis TaxID=2058289 RepID=UPI0022E88427|nr:host-nuclease inhibitor Gam family protein [Acidaminococcus provencensis]